MGWKNYGHVATVRGVESYERNVFWYIADEADGDGYIESLRISRLCEKSETSRRRLFQILASLEAKGFIERFQRVWDKRSGVAVRLTKGAKKTGKQIPTGYRIRFDRFFPVNDPSTVWAQAKLQIKPKFADGVFRIYIESGVKQTYFVKRTGQLCILAHSRDHKRWIESEAVKFILAIGIDLKPPIRSVKVFYPPTTNE